MPTGKRKGKSKTRQATELSKLSFLTDEDLHEGGIKFLKLIRDREKMIASIDSEKAKDF